MPGKLLCRGETGSHGLGKAGILSPKKRKPSGRGMIISKDTKDLFCGRNEVDVFSVALGENAEPTGTCQKDTDFSAI